MRKGFVLVALTVAGVVGSVGEASAFFRKKKKCVAAVAVAPVVAYSQPACGCGTGVGTSFATPSYHGGSHTPGYGMSGSHYAPSMSHPHAHGTPGMYYPSGR